MPPKRRTSDISEKTIVTNTTNKSFDTKSVDRKTVDKESIDTKNITTETILKNDLPTIDEEEFKIPEEEITTDDPCKKILIEN